MKQLTKQQLIAAALGSVLTIGLGAGAITFADTNTGATASDSTASTTQMMHRPGVDGTVTAVSGNTVTVTDKNGKTYTIDASAAKVTKDETVNVSDIVVGDTIVANGTVSGTSVTATNIHDGQMPQGSGFGGRGGPGRFGHGIDGTVSAVDGTTLTVSATNQKTNTTTSYTVDATNAQVFKGDGSSKPSTSTLSSVAIGDNVVIDGSISGTNITAKMIIDGPMPTSNGQRPEQTQNSSTTTTQ